MQRYSGRGYTVTYLYSNGASPEVYTSMVNVTSISGPTSERGEIDTTDLSSTARENISALIDHGTIDVQCMWDENATSHAAIRALFVADTERNWRITNAASPLSTYTFAARVKGIPLDYASDEVVRASFTLRVSGALTIA